VRRQNIDELLILQTQELLPDVGPLYALMQAQGIEGSLSRLMGRRRRRRPLGPRAEPRSVELADVAAATTRVSAALMRLIDASMRHRRARAARMTYPLEMPAHAEATLRVQETYASVGLAMANYKKQERALVTALRAAVRVFGPGHPSLVWATINLHTMRALRRGLVPETAVPDGGDGAVCAT